METKSYGCLLGVALFWCGITGVFLGFVVGGVARHVDAQRRFLATDGTVLSSEVRTSRGSKSTQYRPEIRTRYEVGGKEYVTDRYTFDSSTSNSAEELSRRIVEGRPPGSRVRVHYDPARPEVAILELAIPTRLWFLFLFLQPFLTIGAGLIWGLVSHFPARRRVKRFLAVAPSFPWDIPSWGVMDSPDGALSIEHRPPRLAIIGGAYCITSLLSCFLVGFTGLFYDGVSDAPGWAIAAGFAVSAAAAIAGGSRLAARKRRSVRVDSRERKVSVSGAGGDRVLPFDAIQELLVSRPLKLEKGVSVPGDARLSAVLKAGDDVELHEFAAIQEGEAIARKAGEVLAEAARVPLRVDGGPFEAVRTGA